MLIATAVLSAVAGGCANSSGDKDQDTGADIKPAKLSWKSCKPKGEAAQQPGAAGIKWECAKLPVPVDYDKPDGDKIDLALIRTKATGKKEPIGSLIYNFGGPGGSGVSTLPAAAPQYEGLRTRYDLLSFDPRGVGDSEGVRCLGDKQLDSYFAADNTPDDEAEQKAYFDNIKKFNSGCEKNAGKILPHIGTENAARDIDLIRKAVGDDKTYYFGTSYGTELGGVYAHQFPKKVGRAVLDSPIDPTQDGLGRSLGQTKGFQLALKNFTEDCADQGEECPLGEDPKEGEGKIADLLQQLDKKPMPAAGERKLTESLATGGIAQALYSKDFWPILREGLDEAMVDGNGRTLLALGDLLNGREQNGRYSTMQSSFVAIGCADSSERPDTDEIKDKLPEFEKASPLFGKFMAWSMGSCTDWPVKGARTKPDVSAKDSAPILVVGTTNDPATPFAGTKHMVDALGVGHQITNKGEGHGAYTPTNPCVTKAVDAYLLQGRTPEDGKTCG
nr:alpha/beta hydrolase [Streptomyces coryli]